MIARLSYCFAVFALVSSEDPQLHSQDNVEVVEFQKIQEGFRSSIAMIQSIRVNYECRSPATTSAVDGKFEFAGKNSSYYFNQISTDSSEGAKSVAEKGMLKKRLRINGGLRKVFSSSSEHVEVIRSGAEANISEPNPLANRLQAENPWFLAGVYITSEPIYTWANLFGAESVVSISKESLNGVDVFKVQTVALSIEDFPIQCTVYFEPGVNFLVKRYLTEQKLENEFGVKWVNVCTFDCTEFFEVKTGLYFPKRTKNRSFSKFEDGRADLVIYEISTNFSSVEINSPISDESFEFKVPTGMLVNDFRKMISYRTGPDGKPVGVPGNLGGNDSSMIGVGWKTRWAALCFTSLLVFTFVFFRYLKSRKGVK